jgi:hypothetical protein
MPTKIVDKQGVEDLYEYVRDDNNPLMWFTLTFDEQNNIVTDEKGEEYDEFLARLSDDVRMFAYVRVTTGDEMSKRAKFALITWVGSSVTAMKKAKMSVEKVQVKTVLKNFAIEILATEKSECAFNTVKTQLIKAGGANYGTGGGAS